MKTIANRLLTAVLLAITLALSSVCVVVVAGAAAGAGEAVYSGGELKATEYTSFDKAWDAAVAAMNDLGYAITAKEKEAVESKITARAQGDKKITVRVIKVSGTMAEFQIRVGSGGDKAESQQILDAIKKHL